MSILDNFISNRILNEEFMELKTNIEFVCSEHNKKVLTITSAMKSEGKTNVVVGLSKVLEQTNKKVIVLDCNLRNPNLDKVFKLDNKKGIVDITNGSDNLENIVNKISDNLHVVCVGTKNVNPNILFESAEFKEFVNKLKLVYDYVLIDSPDIGNYSETMRLTNIADGVILVISILNAKYQAVMKAKEKLNLSNSNLIGIVVNKK